MTRALYRLALLAYPRAFRRRFGREMLQALGAETLRGRASRTRAGHAAAVARALAVTVAAGVAERGAAVERALFWPSHQPHLYADSRRTPAMGDTFRADVRHALRLARKTPGATAVTTLALALGIGATSAIAAVVNGVLFAPLPYQDPDRLVVVWSDATRQGRPRNTMSPADYRDLAARQQTLGGLEAYFSFVTPLELQVDGPTEVALGVTVTPGLFPLLGRGPSLGRLFAAHPQAVEVVISHGYWQRRFGADPAAVGRQIRIGDLPVTIVGVMPADFTFPYGTMLGPSGFTRVTTVDLWAPMAFEGPLAAANRMLTPQGELVRGVRWLGAIGRMRPGVSVDEVQADLSAAARQLEQRYPETNGGWGTTVVPVLDQTVGTVRAPLLVLLAGVGFVLAIAAVNVANLVLARTVARQKELATRVALGASRARLVQQALTEGLLLAGAGGLLGLLVARWGLAALVALAPPDLPRLADIAPDRTLLIVAAAATLLTGLFVGLLPALTTSRVTPQAGLQDQGRGTTGSVSRRRTRAALVMAEMALAVTLTVGAGLLLRSFVALLAVDPGFRPDHLLTWQMNLPDRLRTPEARNAFYREFLDRMRALPGVVSVGGTTRLPLGSTGLTTSIDIEGRDLPQGQWPEVQFRRAIGDYFQAMGIPLLRGRAFDDADGPSAPPVCVVNQALAAKLFPGEDPVGRRVRGGQTQPWMTIVGVIGDIKHGALDEAPEPELYVSHRQGSVVNPYVVLRTTGNAADMVDLVRAEARALDPDLPLYRLETMATVRAESVAQRRFVLVLVGAFGVLALTLAALGVYGVMSLTVRERTQELGVRLALGARPGQVLRMVVRQAVGLATCGVLAGLAAAVPLLPLLRSQLFGVTAADPLTLAAAPLILVAVATLAALLPARRAMRVDPVQALRME